MSNLFDKELFKNSLRAQGNTDYTDKQMDSMFNDMTSMYDSLGKTLFPSSVDPGSITAGGFEQQPMNMRTQAEMDALGPSGLHQFVGGLTWEAVNTAFFGAPGVIDYEDSWENWLKYGDTTPTVEEGTLKQSAAMKWGSGLGGLAGFVAPWGPWATGTKAVQGATKALSKHSTQNIVKNLTSKKGPVSTFLNDLRPKLWGKASVAKKKEVFESITKPILRFCSSFSLSSIALL